MIQKGMLIDGSGDLSVVQGHIQMGTNLLQQASIVLGLTQGDLKEDPLCGANLLRHIRGKTDKAAIDRTVKIQFARAGIDYEEVKEKLNIEMQAT